MKRFNPIRRQYEEYNLPIDWYCPLVTDNMDLTVNCPGCGKEIKFGDGYTSRQFVSEGGFGYTVCGSCYRDEWRFI